MKVQQLIDQLSFIPPNYDVMVKVGDSERDLITKIGSIKCVNSKINPSSGFIELETCNAIDWRRAFYNDAISKANVYKAIQEIMKYEHEGFINISLARLDEILKKCGVSENGNDD